ncbi:hypothetical protein VTJ04DRAFT_10352 [Mycothermus thermophilus]|uniref:uncharacterized protein n=1 Tax=Humicola insolens TaxID=85995 RepID=UPI003744906F
MDEKLPHSRRTTKPKPRQTEPNTYYIRGIVFSGNYSTLPSRFAKSSSSLKSQFSVIVGGVFDLSSRPHGTGRAEPTHRRIFFCGGAGR